MAGRYLKKGKKRKDRMVASLPRGTQLSSGDLYLNQTEIIQHMQHLFDKLKLNSDYKLISLVENPTQYSDYIIKNEKTGKFFVLSLPTAGHIASSGAFNEGVKERFNQTDPSTLAVNNNGVSIVDVEVLTPICEGSHWTLKAQNVEIDDSGSGARKTKIKSEASVDSLKGNLDGTKQEDGWSCGYHVVDNVESAISGNSSIDYSSSHSSSHSSKQAQERAQAALEEIENKAIELSKTQTNISSSLAGPSVVDSVSEYARTMVYTMENKPSQAKKATTQTPNGAKK